MGSIRVSVNCCVAVNVVKKHCRQLLKVTLIFFQAIAEYYHIKSCKSCEHYKTKIKIKKNNHLNYGNKIVRSLIFSTNDSDLF